MIEVSDSSIQYDRGPKLAIYARYGVREVWIEDLMTDTLSRQVFVELKGGATLVFPCELAQRLSGASDEDLAAVEISPSCRGLRWPRLDADFSLGALIQGVFGDQAWMRRLTQRRRNAVRKKRLARARRRRD